MLFSVTLNHFSLIGLWLLAIFVFTLCFYSLVFLLIFVLGILLFVFINKS